MLQVIFLCIQVHTQRGIYTHATYTCRFCGFSNTETTANHRALVRTSAATRVLTTNLIEEDHGLGARRTCTRQKRNLLPTQRRRRKVTSEVPSFGTARLTGGLVRKPRLYLPTSFAGFTSQPKEIWHQLAVTWNPTHSTSRKPSRTAQLHSILLTL